MVDRAWSHVLIQHMDITPVVAADETVWNSLGLVAVPDLVRWRFPEPVPERYVGVADHAFGRLWWRAFVLGEDLIDGLGAEPLSEDELVALFRRRDLVANPAVAQAIATAVLRSASLGAISIGAGQTGDPRALAPDTDASSSMPSRRRISSSW